MFLNKIRYARRQPNRNKSLRNRRLRIESLEGRRLLCADGAHAMHDDHDSHEEHGSHEEHAMGVTVTETTVATHHDTIPRFGAHPTNVAVLDGLWSDPNVWSTGQVPQANDIVRIPSCVTLVYDVYSDFKLDAIEVSGRLDFATNANTSLWLNELMIMPMGTLTVGTEANPVSASVTAEIVITDTPGSNGLHYKTGTVEQPGIDPSQWGNAILAFGTLEMHGQEKTSSYIRVAEEPLAGHRVLVLESEPIGWRPGDELVLPDTRSDWNRAATEELIIESIDGNRVTLTQPLAHDHRGPRSEVDGAPLFLPHIGNLTRNVVVRSENPEGTRGHVAFFAKADIDVRFARFKDLGTTTSDALDATTFDAHGNVTRIGTNQAGRYAMHFHHVEGPNNPTDTGFQFEVVGNAVDGALRWGITVHGSHYGLIKDNFVYDYQGAGFVTEDGTEAYNLFEGNFAVLSNARGSFKLGDAGEGFWFRSPLTRAIDNVSANSQRSGFIYYVQDLHGDNQDNWIKPAFRGADMTANAQVIRYNVLKTPMLQFERNEVYGAHSVFDNWSSIPNEKQYLGDLVGWNTSRVDFAISSYINTNLVVDNLTLVGDLSTLDPNRVQKYQPIAPIGIQAVRRSDNITILNSEFRGVRTGFQTPPRPAGQMVIADSLFQAYIGVHVNAMTKSNKLDTSGDYARLVIQNTRFERMPENNVQPDQFAIYMQFELNTDVTKTNEVFLYDFNGVPGANYRVYYPEQAPNFIVPATSSSVIGAPEPGLTNAETWDRFGIAIGGAVAPTREYDGDNGQTALARGLALGIHGLVFPLDGYASHSAAPVVNAGPQFTVEQYRQVQLSGQVTDDGLTTGDAGGAARVNWSKRSGPGEVSFGNMESIDTLAMFTDPGTYVLRLTANDGLKESYDDVTITVLEASNRAPVVDAGSDVVLNDSNAHTLKGTARDDGNPYGMLETQWSVVSGPGAANFADPYSLTTEVVFTSRGDYVLALTANDGELISSDFIKVTVNVALPQSPLLVHLKMDDWQGLDSSVHELHGESSGIYPTDGKFGTAFDFYGNSHVAMPSTDFLQPQNGLTTALWIRPSVTDGVMRPVLVWDGGSWDAYKITLTNRSESARLNASVATNGNKIVGVTTAPFPTDQWTHLALTYSQENGGEIRLYRDGQLIGTEQQIGGPITYNSHSDRRLTLGKEHPRSTDPGFIGAMDDLHVYDYALTPAELAHVMMGYGPHSEDSSGYADPYDLQLLESASTSEPLIVQTQNLTEEESTAGASLHLEFELVTESEETYSEAVTISTFETGEDDSESSDSWMAEVDAALTAGLDLDDLYAVV